MYAVFSAFKIFHDETEKNNSILIEPNDELINIIYQNVISYDEIDLSVIINFEWDEIFIIQPYKNPKSAFEEEHLKWKELRTAIEIRDNITLIVFLLNKEIISYVNYPRLKGDFQNNGIFKRDSTRFKVEYSILDEGIYLNHVLVQKHH